MLSDPPLMDSSQNRWSWSCRSHAGWCFPPSPQPYDIFRCEMPQTGRTPGRFGEGRGPRRRHPPVTKDGRCAICTQDHVVHRRPQQLRQVSAGVVVLVAVLGNHLPDPRGLRMQPRLRTKAQKHVRGNASEGQPSLARPREFVRSLIRTSSVRWTSKPAPVRVEPLGRSECRFASGRRRRRQIVHATGQLRPGARVVEWPPINVSGRHLRPGGLSNPKVALQLSVVRGSRGGGSWQVASPSLTGDRVASALVPAAQITPFGVRVHRPLDDDLRRRRAEALHDRAEPLARRLRKLRRDVHVEAAARGQRERPLGRRAVLEEQRHARGPAVADVLAIRMYVSRAARRRPPRLRPAPTCVPVTVAPAELCASYQCRRRRPGHHIARSTITGTPLVDAASSTRRCRPAAESSRSTQMLNRLLAPTV